MAVGSIAGSTVALQQKGCRLGFQPGIFLDAVSMFSLCIDVFSRSTLASLHIPKTCLLIGLSNS